MNMVEMLDRLLRYIIVVFQLLAMAHNDLALGPSPEDTSEMFEEIGLVIQHNEWIAAQNRPPQSYNLLTAFSQNGSDVFTSQDIPTAKKSLLLRAIF